MGSQHKIDIFRHLTYGCDSSVILSALFLRFCRYLMWLVYKKNVAGVCQHES